jgi:electron transfer flavoprotein beta subunit
VLVCCGDHSLDRGSGSVPAFLAATLGRAQALGLVRATVDDADDTPGGATGAASGRGRTIIAVRRLDHGRREVLEVRGAAVLSFEGGTAELRRAPLSAVLAARTAPVDVRPGPGAVAARTHVSRHAPYRPRARALAPPPPGSPRDRILALTGASVDRDPPQTVTATTAEAADLVLDQLRTWGYLP